VRDRLVQHGFEVVPQVGVAGYFIDLAVKHPKRSGYILGIECDGAMYHSSKSARDRDRLREEVLIGLKWNIYRIWSTDWFADPQQQFKRLERFPGGLSRFPPIGDFQTAQIRFGLRYQQRRGRSWQKVIRRT
jgi:very-short-patch-repair endonuclease